MRCHHSPLGLLAPLVLHQRNAFRAPTQGNYSPYVDEMIQTTPYMDVCCPAKDCRGFNKITTTICVASVLLMFYIFRAHLRNSIGYLMLLII